MKILHVVETAAAGVGRHVLDLAEGQAARGHAVTVVWSPSRAEPAFIDRLAAMPGITNAQITMERAVGLHDWRSYRALKDYVATHGPFDVLHGQSSKGGALMRLLPRRLGGLRVYNPHAFRTQDPELSGPARIFYRLIERILGWRTDRIIAVSEQEIEHAVSALAIARDRLVLVLNGAGPDNRMTRSQAREAMGIGPDEVAVGFIGRLSHQKFPQRFIEAVEIARRQANRLVGVMIGDGEMRDECEAAAQASRVRFLGWQDGPMLIKGFDIFCMTSRYEGFPYALLEAIHAGVPIVTTDIGGARVAVVEGETGVVLPRDAGAAAIGAELARLANDDALRLRWSEQCLQLAAGHTLARMVDDTLAVYREGLDDTGLPR